MGGRRGELDVPHQGNTELVLNRQGVRVCVHR